MKLFFKSWKKRIKAHFSAFLALLKRYMVFIFYVLSHAGKVFFVTSKGMRYLQLAKSMIAIFHCVLGYFLSRSASCKTGRKKCWKKPQPKIGWCTQSLLYCWRINVQAHGKGQQRIIDQQSILKAEVKEPLGMVGMRPNKFLVIIVLAVSFIGFFPFKWQTDFRNS